ncbi:hypothetical protein EWM64_g9317 [Hericium alpestre]|uniref:Uncharacterized protein n=1 Tax=Hericium alpestre TaxID=135208 RepID=A0A4Y9ZJC8_9AGAM|nr:hypothetical protein EWM64_g9317 [Hericium alpestre]
MLDYQLREEILGTKVTVGRREVWTHVQWAKHMLELAEKASIATSMQNIWLIRHELPDIMKDFVPEMHADWTAFMQTVTDIDITQLRDKVDAKWHCDGELACMNADVQRLTAQRDTVCQAINALQHHPDMDAGHAAYQVQLTRFTETHRFSPYITEHTLVSLHPGTEPLCLDECWSCSWQGHCGDACIAPLQDKVLDVECK